MSEGRPEDLFIGLREAKEELERGRALFVDVRKREEYERCHIPGAVSVPLREIIRREAKLPLDRPIIFY